MTMLLRLKTETATANCELLTSRNLCPFAVKIDARSKRKEIGAHNTHFKPIPLLHHIQTATVTATVTVSVTIPILRG